MFKRVVAFLLVLTFFTSAFSSIAYAGIDTTKEPPANTGYKRDSKTPKDKKVKNPNTGKYGFKDDKGRIWVPDRNQHGGEGWTREWPDGSHDHSYPNGHERKHKGTGKANYSVAYPYGNNVSTKKVTKLPWWQVALFVVVGAAAFISPIPGDEVIVGGMIFAW